MNDIADVLVITVTQVESQSVLDAFQGHTKRPPRIAPLDGKAYHDFGTVNGVRVWHSLSEMGTGGLGGSQQAISRAVATLHPRAVVMTGIAFGINETKQRIGDILVSENLRLYELQRVGAGQKPAIKLRGDRPHASPWLLDCFRNARLHWNEADVRFGLVLSGEKLVDNLDFRQQLRSVEPEAIGGEMEGGGLYVACQDAKVDWILVKAICDWADGKKDKNKKQWQKRAARNSAMFVLHALTTVGLKRSISLTGFWIGHFTLNKIRHIVGATIWMDQRTLRCAMILTYEFRKVRTIVEERFSCRVEDDTITMKAYDSSFLVRGNEGSYHLDTFQLVLSPDGMTLSDALGHSDISLSRKH